MLLDHPSCDAGAVIARIERARTELTGPVVVASDADGTLWSGDVGEDLFESALDARALRDEAREALADEALRFHVDAEGDATAIARGLHRAFAASRYPSDRAFAMMAWAFAGWREDELARFAAEVIVARKLASRMRPELTAVLAHCARQGLEVLVVSASPRAVVVAGAALLGLDATRVLAVTPRARDGRITPELEGPLVYGDGKVSALRSARPEAALLAAFGDSSYDAALLRAARVPVAVHPSRGLLDVAHTIPELLVLGPR